MTNASDSASSSADLLVRELKTAEFVPVSVAVRLCQERIQHAAIPAVVDALEYAAANLYFKWLNGYLAEGIRSVTSLLSDIRHLAPHSSIIGSVYALSLFEQGDLSSADGVFATLPPTSPVLPLIESRCATAIRQINTARKLNVAKARPSKLLLLDSAFPSRSSSFRYGEFSTYLNRVDDSSYMARPDPSMFAYEGQNSLESQVKRYSEQYHLPVGRIRRFDSTDIPLVQLAYCVFLNQADLFFSQIGIPSVEHFVFTLYPGGGFALHDQQSDSKLRRLCEHPKLAKIITTQKATYEYLVENRFCERDRIEHIFGVVVPIALEVPRSHSRKVSRAPLKVCFVAHRYTEVGAEKGYDVFCAVVRALANSPDFHFYVVGNFDRSVIDLKNAQNVTFHGIKEAGFFPHFYSEMDMILSPNAQMATTDPSGPAYFDGFPTTCVIEAGLQGVAMFATDFMKMNSTLTGTPIFSNEEIVFIDRDVSSIVDMLVNYERDREALATLGEAGRQAVLREFSFDKQMRPRLDLLSSYLHD